MDLDKLEKLGELREKGIITQEEFEAKKKELLSPDTIVNDPDNTERSLWGYFVNCTFAKFACFKGRARRKEFWGFCLFSYLIRFVVVLGVTVMSTNNNFMYMENLVSFVYTLLFLLPSLGVTVRRLHDVNYSGWWILVPFVPTILVFFKSDMKTNKYGSIPAGVR